MQAQGCRNLGAKLQALKGNIVGACGHRASATIGRACQRETMSGWVRADKHACFPYCWKLQEQLVSCLQVAPIACRRRN
eukprot:1153770-Pelagomonas_calceolata.AAC.8